jgi:hypothetical protein
MSDGCINHLVDELALGEKNKGQVGDHAKSIAVHHISAWQPGMLALILVVTAGTQMRERKSTIVRPDK